MGVARTISFFSSAALVAALLPCVPFASAQQTGSEDIQSYVADEVLVVYEDSAAGIRAADGAAEAALDRICDVESVETIASQMAGQGEGQVINLEDGEDLDAAIAKLNSVSGVAYAQKNYVYELQDVVEDGSTDSYISSQYYLDSWDSSFTTTCGANVKTAWSMMSGAQSVTVAVLDTGCAVDHEDLAANIDVTHAYNAVTSEKGASAVVDTEGHGTHVTGIIAAAANNGKGIAGVANNLVKVIPVKVFGSNGAETSDLVKAYTYLQRLVDRKEVTNLHAINMSLGGYGEDDILLNMAIKIMRQRNVLTVAAGGNGKKNSSGITEATTDYCYPADEDSVLSVTALDEKGNNASYSDYNQYKDISAPGNSILSTVPSSLSGAKYRGQSGNYKEVSGTSMATPLVTGIAALLWADNPNLTCDQVVKSITTTAHPVNTSKNDRTGQTGSAGAIDAAAALSYSIETFAERPMDISSASLSLESESYDYTDAEIYPVIQVTYKGKVLKEGTDYSVKYSNNVNAGTATVTVSGIGEYSGSVSGSFYITPADISKAAVSLTPASFEHDGSRHCPDVCVSLNDRNLQKDIDFTVEFSATDCVSVGTHVVTVVGKGNYTGSAETSFEIVESVPEEVALPSSDPADEVKDSKDSKESESVSKDIGSAAADVDVVAFSKTATINKKKVTAKDVRRAAKKGAVTIVLGSKVRKVSTKAFKGTNVRTIVVKTKHLRKSKVKGSLKSSKVKTVKVKVGSARLNKKFKKAYKSCFTTKNCGKKVSLK